MEEGSSLPTPTNRSALLLEGFIGSFEGSGAGIVSAEDVIFLKDLLLSCNLISDISETLYMKLLCFLAENWGESFAETSIADVPLFKHLDQHGRVYVCSVNDAAKGNCRICMSSDSQLHSWLLKWNLELKDASAFLFIPESTFLALHLISKQEKLYSWMHEYLGILDITLHDFSYTVLCSLQSTNSKGLLIGFTHFLFNSFLKKYLTEDYISALCESMPLVDKYGTIVMARNGALLPASMSKWVELACTNLWSENSYVELSSDYFYHQYSAGENVDEIQLSDFLKRCINASDVPEIRPPDARLPAAFSPLSKDNALLLLDWIGKAMDKGKTLPVQFSRSVTEGKWLKTNLGFKSPSESFLPTSHWESLLHIGSVAECVPLVDENFYDNQIHFHVNELESLGVVTDVEECCLFVAYRLVSPASTITLRKDSVLSLLGFIRYVVKNKLASDQIIRIFQEERWLKTSKGCRAPAGCVLFNAEWEAVQQISDLPFVDESYYGEKIRLYKDELKLLGVVVSFDKNYSLIGEHFKLPDILHPMTFRSSILILECVGHSSLSSHMLDAIKGREWIKTNLGYRCPNKCFLYNSAWGCLLHWADVPVIDESFYENSISSYMHELETIGVSVCFDSVCKNIIDHVKLLLCPSLTKEASLLLLECLKQLKTNGLFLKCELKDCISQQLWLKTCHGFLSPCGSAVYDSRWEPITQIADLPFIDKDYYGEDIYGYIDELCYIGVAVEFSKAFHLVVTGFKYPKHRAKITASVVLSLLECIKFQLSVSSENPLPAEFLRCMREKKWLKTYMGYRSPVRCFLYDSDWEDFLRREDAPFIDESYYGSDIVSYWQELSSIGVKVRVGSGCRLISQCLRCHTDSSPITRIYSYLQTFNWEPEAEEKSDCWIWIPSENCSAGEWVNANHCVLRAEDNVPSTSSRVLARYYDENLLSFFKISFGVGSHTRK